MKGISIWILTPLMVALLGFALNDRLRRRALSLRAASAVQTLTVDRRLYWAAFALCMLAGVLVRCWRFGVLPLGLNHDEAMAAVEGYCLGMDGTDQYGTSWPTYFEAWGFSQMSTLYSYLLIPFIRVLGLSRVTSRLPMMLVSVAMLPLIWDFARRIAGRGYALLTLFLLAINPWQILQSRWGLEANLMPHVLLTAAYLLYIGRQKRWALYLSMVFFALTPYAYGLACFVLPIPMLGMAAYYLVKRYAKIWDVLVCGLIFSLVAGPYIATMVVNAFGLETLRLGPVTMPLFAESHRTNEMIFSYVTAYQLGLQNVKGLLDASVFGSKAAVYNAIDWAHAMYRFAAPLYVFGAYRLWRDRRRLAAQGVDEALCAAGMLLLLWLAGTAMSATLTGTDGSVNRNNALYYPLIFFTAYALLLMGRRLRIALAAAATVFALSFAALCGTYFGEDYQKQVGDEFRYGLQEALLDTWDWDYDRYYLTNFGRNDGVKQMTANLMFAHRISYAQRSEQTDLTGPDGQPTGWYFTERYVFTDYEGFEPDPMECAVYIITSDKKSLFDPEEYLFTDYGEYYSAVYPRYWAE